MTFAETLVRDSFLWLHVASYGLVAVVRLKWPPRLQQYCTYSHVQHSPSAQVEACFEAPHVTLHTGNRAAETTDGKQRKTSSHSLHFLFLSQWAFYCRFAASFAVLHTSTAFSLLLLPVLASPSFSSAFCSLYYFWPLGRGYSHGDTDKAIRTLNGGPTLLVEGRYLSIAKSRALPHVPLWLHFKNLRKNFEWFDPAQLRRLSERNNCRTIGLIFMKFNVGNFSLNFVRKFQFRSKSER